MANIKAFFVISIVLASVNGFLFPDRNPSSSKPTAASITDQDLVDALNVLGKVVFQMQEEMSQLKQHNVTELMEETTILKQKNHDLEQEVVALSLQNAALTEKVMNNDVHLRNISELKEDTEQLNNMMNNIKLENQALQVHNKGLKQEITDLKQQDEKVKNQNAALNEKLTNNTAWLRNISGNLNTDGSDEILNFLNDRISYIHSLKNLQVDNNDLKQEVANLNLQNAALTEKVMHNAVLLNNISANQNISVAFSAKLPGTTSATSSGLKFSYTFSNIGGGYNGSDGVFYCPKDGLYLFSVTVEGYPDRTYVNADFMKNTNQLALLHEWGSGNSYQTASLTLTLNLRIGDRIWIKGMGIRYNHLSYFTGILIK